MKKVNVTWQYIVFDYNKNHIQEAKEIAKANGINFNLMISNRKFKSSLLGEFIVNG